MINIVGDHASYHLAYDAPLTSDIESLAGPMSHWVRRMAGPDAMDRDVGEAYAAAMSLPGVTTLILPADTAWSDASANPISPAAPPAPAPVDPGTLDRAAQAIRSGRRVAFMMTGRAVRADALALAGRIAAKTGIALWTPMANGRVERGVGRVPIKRLALYP
jgi:acetolactate synthase-1/2/3 large subunit